MKRYIPLFATLAAAGLGAAVSALTDGVFTDEEKIIVASSVVGAASVFTAPNIPGATYVKFAISMISPVLAFCVSAITDGISASEWMQIGTIALGPVVVLAAPNPVSQAMSSEEKINE